MHVQRLVSVVKIATVLEEYKTEEQRSVVRLLWAKGLNAKNIHKKISPVYGGKCLSRKAVHNWTEKFYQGRLEVADDARLGRPLEIATETTVQWVEALI
jgi:transposase